MEAVNWSDFARDERIGAGAFRVVYGYDAESVLKIDSRPSWNGQSPNAKELARWVQESVTPNRQFLATILEATDGPSPWLRMERVVGTLADYVWQHYSNGRKPERQYDFPPCPNHGADCYDWMWFTELPEIQPLLNAARAMGLIDMHPWNIGVRADGTFVIIDYAD